MDCTAVNMHRMAIERMYRIGFVLKRIANASNRPSTGTVCFGKWHDLYMRPMYHDDFQRPDDGMPDTVPQADSEPSQRGSNLVWHPNSLVG